VKGTAVAGDSGRTDERITTESRTYHAIRTVLVVSSHYAHLHFWPAMWTWVYSSLNKHATENNTSPLKSCQAIIFYRATRMHSADYAVARCLSVCLSHAGIESKRLYISSKFFSPSGSPTILVFSYQTGWQYSDGDPHNGGVECKGV